VGNFRIPVPIAVAAWAASGLAVLSYTYLAFKETASGAEPTKSGTRLSAAAGKKELQELVSDLPELKPLKNPTPITPLNRNKFQKSNGR
jgi:hypothetical protein